MTSSIFCQTGNPFVDAGIFAITEWVGKTTPEQVAKEDVASLLPKLEQLYFGEGWKKTLYSIFPNNGVTHPSKGKTTKAFNATMGKMQANLSAGKEMGTCICCGQRIVPEEERFYRDYIPLTGSGELLNFFPAARLGTDYCYNCVMAVQFFPLMIEACGGKFILIHCGSNQIMRIRARQAIKEVIKQLTLGHYSGPGKWEKQGPKVALIKGITEIINQFSEELEEDEHPIRLYYFTNYGQGPDLSFYDLPGEFFLFLLRLKIRGYLETWEKEIASRGFKQDKQGNQVLYHNEIYDRLLNLQSIAAYFVDSKNKRAVGGWELFKIYLIEVEKMDFRRLEEIRKVGNTIARVIKRLDKPKRVFMLEKAGTYPEMLRVLYILTKDNLVVKGKEPLITLEQLTEQLFPEGAVSWKETKYLLLFVIYEELHDWLITEKEAEIDEEEINEEELS
jgi:CRISPR-associated protein Cst1